MLANEREQAAPISKQGKMEHHQQQQPHGSIPILETSIIVSRDIPHVLIGKCSVVVWIVECVDRRANESDLNVGRNWVDCFRQSPLDRMVHVMRSPGRCFEANKSHDNGQQHGKEVNFVCLSFPPQLHPVENIEESPTGL